MQQILGIEAFINEMFDLPFLFRQWDQRFWANYDNYAGEGLAFLFIGGESEASPGWLNYGMWYEWAKLHGAAMFVLEHRYE